jgi:predicted ATPase/DNA-binding SARP family transcriptional activator
MADLKFSLFGPPQFERNSIRVDFGLRKSTAILSFLAAEKKVYAREELAAIFWPEEDHSTALANLRRALYRINHASGVGLVISSRSTVELNRNIDLWLDIEEFDRLIGDCLPNSQEVKPECMQKLLQAKRLYTADFLAGFTLPDCPAFDDWQFFQMDSLKRSYNSVLKWLVQEFRERGELEEAIGHARRRLALDQLDEAAHRDLMELYGLNSQFEAAVRQYDECCRILQSELKVQPAEETTSLYQRIRQRRSESSTSASKVGLSENFAKNMSTARGTTPEKAMDPRKISRPGPSHNLQVQTFPFVGRKQELTEIRRLLLNTPERRLITITGPGGIGKTRLALEAASLVVRDFPDGVFQVPLTHLNLPDDIPQAVADRIGMGAYQGSVNMDKLLDYLQDKHMLIILDSYEHLSADISFVTRLLENTQWVKILCTSRERLALSSETVYSLVGMEVPDLEDEADIYEYSAVKLFIQSAKLVRPYLELNEEEISTMIRICRYVQGMPLAIVLSAGWLQVIDLHQIAEEIEQNLDFLEGTMRDLPERQRSVRAAFEYSWKRLPKSDQTAFMRLCIFSGGFSSQSAQKVAGVSISALRNLIDKSFVYLQQDGRYQIHALLRQFGAEYLEMSGEAEKIHVRHSENYLTLLGEREADLKGRNQVAALREIETDFPNIRTAWEYAVRERRWSVVKAALGSLFLFCDLRGRHRTGVELIDLALKCYPNADPGFSDVLYGSLMIHHGLLRTRYERFCPEIGDILRTGLELIKRHGDDRDKAFALLALGHFYMDSMQEFSQALPYFRKSRLLFSNVGDDYYLGRAVHMLGVCCAFLNGNYELKGYLLESLDIAQRIGDKNSEVMLLVSLAMIDFFLGNIEAARKYAQEAGKFADEVGQGASLAQTDTFIGIIHLTQGQLDQAEQYVIKGSKMAKEVNFPLPMLFSKAVSGILGGLNGNLDESLTAIRECRAFPADPCSNTFILWASALIHTIAGNYDTAREEIRTMVEWDRKYGVPTILRMSLPVILYLLFVENNLPLAVEVLALEEHHPLKVNGWTETWDEFNKVKERLAALSGEKSCQARWRRGKGKSLESLIEEVLSCWELIPEATLL